MYFCEDERQDHSFILYTVPLPNPFGMGRADRFFASLDEVPLYALTLTVPTLFSCDRIFCVVPAPTKANAAKTAVLGPISEACPSSILRKHPAATLYLDSDSGKYLL